MTLRFSLAAVGAALWLACAAAAHSGAPFLTKGEAERRVLLGSFDVGGREPRISDAACFGVGKIRLRVGRVVKFRHFDCLLTPARDRRFWIRFHSLKKNWTYAFLRYAG